MKIGIFDLPNQLFVAPMAGVTDRPFRKLSKRLGAGYAVSEMVTSRLDLMKTLKTSRRTCHQGEVGPIAVQIAGTDPEMMAEAAFYNLQRGAQIIDINMGCPAKKVCQKWAGSGLMKDENLALSIIDAVVKACQPFEVPVTLKMRTGWSESTKNALSIAKAAESAGVQMITVHGRTREQGFGGFAEYQTIKAIKNAVRIPVVANGDVDSPQKAKAVLEFTKADALMIGRAAQGRPWIFREIAHYLSTSIELAPPLIEEVRGLLLEHLQEHYDLYGSFIGVRSARKHISWYTKGLQGSVEFMRELNKIENTSDQMDQVNVYLDALGQTTDRWPSQSSVEMKKMECVE
ncbi:MAG: tRNA dihydrouridine synthase DusB [Betaproteobacteria bacterium]